MQTYERIKELAVRHAQGITDEAEERELHTWLAEDQQREEMFQRLMSREAWNANLRRFVKSPEEEKETWRRILNRTVRREKRLRQRLWIQRAALFLLNGGSHCLVDGKQRRLPIGKVCNAKYFPGQGTSGTYPAARGTHHVRRRNRHYRFRN